MSQLAIFNNFKPIALHRNPFFRQGEYAIWDANLHHRDLRPFACPEVICESSSATTLYPLPECCCASFEHCAYPVKGFCQDQHFYVKNCRLYQATTDEICEGGGCLAGVPKPPPPHATASCANCDEQDAFNECYEKAVASCQTLKKEVDELEAIYFACKRDCKDSGNCADENCDAQFDAWQAKLQAYNKCMNCVRDDVVKCYEAEPPECPCDSIGFYYVMTYTSSHAGILVEGSPSIPSSLVVSDTGYIPNAAVTWTNPPEGYCIVAVNLYRVSSEFEDGTNQMPIEGAEFLHVASFPAGGATSYVDAMPTAETGYPLMTGHPETFPAPPILFLARTEDGVVVADHCRVYISRAGEPMFTLDGIVSIDDRIRHIEAIGNTIFVWTDNYPVRIQYKHTESVMSIERHTIRRRLPLSSSASVCIYGERVYFSSEYGYYAWDLSGYGADIRLITQSLFTPEQWKMIHPQSVVATAFEFGVILYARGLGHGFMLEFGDDGTDTPNLTSAMPLSARLLTAGVNQKLVDKGMVIEAMSTTHNGHIVYRICGQVYGWDWRRDICKPAIHEPGRSIECCPWTVRLYYDSEGKNSFNAARFEWDTRTGEGITLRIHEGHCGDHILVDEMQVVSCRPFGIRGYSSANTHWIEAESCVVAHEFRMATSFSELVSRTNQDTVS